MQTPIETESKSQPRSPAHIKLSDAYGAALKESRLMMHMTQKELAARAGLDRACVSLLERGRKAPNLLTFLRLADAIGESPTEMLTRTMWRMNLAVQQ